MNNINIYQSKMLKYPLTIEEYKSIDSVWKFVEIFAEPFIYTTDYRDNLQKVIKLSYTPEQFYFYEKIANKLLWNLRWLVFYFFLNRNISYDDYQSFQQNYGNYEEIPTEIVGHKIIKYSDEDDLTSSINRCYLAIDYYRSFINKLILVDRNKKQIYFKPMEGSSEIFCKNAFNLSTMMIFFDRSKYETIMMDPYNNRDMLQIAVPFYYQLDYGFPNINLCCYKFCSKKERLRRIERFYYEKDSNGWFQLIF